MGRYETDSLWAIRSSARSFADTAHCLLNTARFACRAHLFAHSLALEKKLVYLNWMRQFHYTLLVVTRNRIQIQENARVRKNSVHLSDFSPIFAIKIFQLKNIWAITATTKQRNNQRHYIFHSTSSVRTLSIKQYRGC